jgi:hypothetical protein
VPNPKNSAPKKAAVKKAPAKKAAPPRSHKKKVVAPSHPEDLKPASPRIDLARALGVGNPGEDIDRQLGTLPSDSNVFQNSAASHTRVRPTGMQAGHNLRRPVSSRDIPDDPESLNLGDVLMKSLSGVPDSAVEGGGVTLVVQPDENLTITVSRTNEGLSLTLR